MRSQHKHFQPMRQLSNHPHHCSILFKYLSQKHKTFQQIPSISGLFYLIFFSSLRLLLALSESNVPCSRKIDRWVWTETFELMDIWIDVVDEWKWMAIKLPEWMDGCFNEWTQRLIGAYLMAELTGQYFSVNCRMYLGENASVMFVTLKDENEKPLFTQNKLVWDSCRFIQKKRLCHLKRPLRQLPSFLTYNRWKLALDISADMKT